MYRVTLALLLLMFGLLTGCSAASPFSKLTKLDMALTASELVNPDLPAQHRKRLPLKVPAFRLCRLATSVLHRGKGIGEHLLFDAIDRVTRITSDVGGVGLVVNAKPGAVEFYRRYGFELMADHPRNLFLPL